MTDYSVAASPADINRLLGIVHHFCGGVYAKQALIEKGLCATQHVHDYDHLSIGSGHFVVAVDGVETEYRGLHAIKVLAHQVHKVTALEDTTWFCLHATNETDPEKVDQVILGHEEN